MTWDSPSFSVVEYSLARAQAAVTGKIIPVKFESVAVVEALSRFNGRPVVAHCSKPPYNQSTRDGFALSGTPHHSENGQAVFQVVGEVAAGCLDAGQVRSGEAVRIMTGAMVPGGTVRVVPFELCEEKAGTVAVPFEVIAGAQTYIQPTGSEVKEGKLLVPPRVKLLPDHLLMLAEDGVSEVTVTKTPEVAVVCTGSELVEMGKVCHPGQKISGNGVLLQALLAAENVKCCCAVTVADRLELITQNICQALDQGADMIVTTGGMGPGKFDLMEQVFANLGGTIVYNRLRLRPGKYTLMGFVRQRPFFALPGPPPAVRLLFHEMVVPALRSLQGAQEKLAPLVSATLMHTLSIKRTGHQSLKSGFARLINGSLQVYPSGRMEPSNCSIHLPQERHTAEYGEQVQVRLFGSLTGLTM